MKKVLFIICVSCVTILMSCKKEVTQKEYLTKQGWMQNKGFFESNGTEVYNYFAETQECRKDDILMFNSDGTYTITDGASSCLTPRNEDGRWELINGDKGIKIYAPSDTIVFNIDEITDNKCVFNSNAIYEGIDVINRMEFEAK